MLLLLGMMHHLDTDDMKLLDEVLTQHLRGLLGEIAHADSHSFRDDLRRRYEKLEALRRRLTESEGARTVTAH